MNVEQRQEIERQVVTHIIRTMKAKGWEVAYVRDGDSPVKCHTEAAVLDTVFSVDESMIAFVKQDGLGVGMIRSAVIILGNDGWDCIADHSCSSPYRIEDDFEKIMDEEIFPYCESLDPRN